MKASTPVAASSVQTANSQYKETEPSAARIAVAIAASPYSPTTAGMDILDNSVENGATNIAVKFEEAAKQIKRIVFSDNGSGISLHIIDEVLRAGSRTKHLYGATSLSRYGVGLKGAGFSLANRITVLTRSNGHILRRSIDRKQIEATDKWVQDVREPNEAEQQFFESELKSLGEGRTGTCVILEDVTLKTRDLSRLRGELVRSAGETYGKFLAANSDIHRLSISIDGVDVESVDPLHRENDATIPLVKREQVNFDDGTSAFFTAVALPHPNTQSAEIVRKYRYKQYAQGFYVYRNGRLIRSGETFSLFSRDFHLNAFRMELEFSSEADAHFPVDVAKSTIVPDEDAIAKLQPMVTAAARTADILWREKDVFTREDIEKLFGETNRMIGSRAKLLVDAIDLKKRAKVPGNLQKRLLQQNQKKAEESSTPTENNTTAPTKSASAPTTAPNPLQALDGYLRPMPHLPGDVLYRPLLDGNLGGVVVEVNLSHPFSKAVFEMSADESRRGIPRRATTAIQQMLYVLGYCEYTLSSDDDGDEARLFEQFRRYSSMNLAALLD